MYIFLNYKSNSSKWVSMCTLVDGVCMCTSVDCVCMVNVRKQLNDCSHSLNNCFAV
uniref:Uncharacterized protein n=1 Tax=Anguilla anguilla TaxID=7936 RepID=A0A0E9X338_ANGAN